MRRLSLMAAVFLLPSLLAACNQALAPTPDTEVAPLNLEGGQIVAWGYNEEGQATVPETLTSAMYTAVAGGRNHSLALHKDGTAVGWGKNNFGQATVPAPPSGETYTAVAAGHTHSLGVLSDGTAVGWGSNISGETTAPAPPSGVSYTAVAAGGSHSLGLLSDGAVVGWGWNAYGQTEVPALPTGVTYTAVAAGTFHSLGLRSDGTVVGWGYNAQNQVTVPPLPSGVTYTAVAAGALHSLALRSDGTVVVWGQGFYPVPALPPGTTYTAISAGAYFNLALRSDGKIIGWGSDLYGQTTVPTPPSSTRYTAIAAGGYHSLALATAVLSQTLSFTSSTPDDAQVGDTYTVTAAATSGLDVTFSSLTPAVCSVAGSTVSLTGGGICTVAADQSGDDTYDVAPQATQSFFVTAAPPLPIVPPDAHLIDFEAAPANRVLARVSLGRGVVYTGSGTPSRTAIPVFGKRFVNGRLLNGNHARVVSIDGSRRLTIARAGSNQPAPNGGSLQLKFYNQPGKLVSVESFTLTNLSNQTLSPGHAGLRLWGARGQPARILMLPALAAGESMVIPLDAAEVNLLEFLVPVAFAVDDVAFSAAAD